MLVSAKSFRSFNNTSKFVFGTVAIAAGLALASPAKACTEYDPFCVVPGPGVVTPAPVVQHSLPPAAQPQQPNPGNGGSGIRNNNEMGQNQSQDLGVNLQGLGAIYAPNNTVINRTVPNPLGFANSSDCTKFLFKAGGNFNQYYDGITVGLGAEARVGSDWCKIQLQIAQERNALDRELNRDNNEASLLRACMAVLRRTRQECEAGIASQQNTTVIYQQAPTPTVYQPLVPNQQFSPPPVYLAPPQVPGNN